MSSPAPDATGATGATRAPATRKRRPWWLWALLALLALAILLFALSQCGNNTDPTGTAAGTTTTPGAADPAAANPTSAAAGTPAAPTADAAAGAAAAGAAGAAGAGDATLTADGTALLPVAQAAGPNGELTTQAGKTATARGVTVQSVPADEGFWAGTNATDRVWVQLSGTDESGYVVQQGDRVDFTGPVTTHDRGFATSVGVDAAEGADQLDRQGAHIQVAKPELRRSAA